MNVEIRDLSTMHGIAVNSIYVARR